MKNVFVTVSGSTPQIITESLYDIMIQRKINIDEIHIITTSHGRERCNEFLFKNSKQFYQFCEDYDISVIDIAIKLHIIKNSSGEELADIRTKEDNRAAANFVHRIIAELTAEEDSSVFASIAGGRKTMSAYMSYALQLYGRKQDRLFHVLIEPADLEFNKDFFYPPPGDHSVIELKNRDGSTMKIPKEQIVITNAEIPFIRLHEHLTLIENLEIDFEELVRITQQKIDEAFAPLIEYDLHRLRVNVFWKKFKWSIKLKPIDMIFYEFMLHKKSIENSSEDKNSKALQASYLKLKPGVESPPLFRHTDLKDSRTRINKAFKDAIKNQHIFDQVKIHSKQHARVATYFLKSFHK